MESMCEFLLRKQSVIIDNYTFRMHYRATTFILLMFSLFLALGQLLGDPIDCSGIEREELLNQGIKQNNYRGDIPAHLEHQLPYGGGQVDSGGMLDTFCWVHSTFTYPAPAAAVSATAPATAAAAISTTTSNKNNSTDSPATTDMSVVWYPGLLPPSDQAKAQPRYQSYYKWVPFFLFMQAITFYFPRFLWKLWEGGKVKGLTDQLQCTVIENPVMIKKKRHLAEYFNNNLHKNHFYAFKFFFCEIVNLINVIMQIFITDKFLGYQFLTYGSRVVQFKDEESYLGATTAAQGRAPTPHPMDEVFPKVTRCCMYSLGSSTSLKTYDALCVLTNNVYNDKIFLFLWFWFVFLSLLSSISFFYRMATFSSGFRHRLLCSELRLVDPQAVKIVSRNCHIGDWFLLFILALNLHPENFKEFFSDLVLKFAQKHSY